MELPAIGFGTFLLKPAVCKEMVLKAIDVGYRKIDTAQYYENEHSVGEAIEEHTIDRKDVVIATKVWGTNLSYDLVLRSTEESLQKLRTSYIDILYVHWPNMKYNPKETWKAFNELVDQGKVREIAFSNFTEALMEEATANSKHPIKIAQLEFHPLLQLRQEREYLTKKAIKLVAYSPMARGLVKGIPELVEVAKKHKRNEFEIAIAWTISQNAIPIPKASSINHLQSNFEAQFIKLDQEDLELIDKISVEKRIAAYWPFVDN